MQSRWQPSLHRWRTEKSNTRNSEENHWQGLNLLSWEICWTSAINALNLDFRYQPPGTFMITAKPCLSLEHSMTTQLFFFSTSITWFKKGSAVVDGCSPENKVCSTILVGMILHHRLGGLALDMALLHLTFWNVRVRVSLSIIASFGPSPCCELCCRVDISAIYSLLRVIIYKSVSLPLLW